MPHTVEKALEGVIKRLADHEKHCKACRDQKECLRHVSMVEHREKLQRIVDRREKK